MGLERMLEHLRGSCLGRGRAVKSTELERTLRLSHAAVGQQVNRLRRKGEPVCSGPEGYFYAANAWEIYATIQYLRQIVEGLEAAITGLERALEKFGEQTDGAGRRR